VTCVDTSFLFSLYCNDAHSHRAVEWIKARKSPITLTPFGEFELGNALRFAEFRKAIAPGQAAWFWSQFESDRASGRLRVEPCNLAEVLQQAMRISSDHTLGGGHRSFDILHVASARVLGARLFLTFDATQARLAAAEGLRVPVL
jgi:predicted nucleic acid-binding protein